MNCTSTFLKTLLTTKDKCIYVSENCPYEYINFYSLHYCLMKGSLVLTSIIIIFFLFMLFFILSSTSDMFLSTSITKIVETFNINQNIAAVTLLAFGNGAPDVISSLVASAEEEGIQFSISSLIGGGMFVTSFVLGAVVFRGKDILVNSSMFNRNLLLYLISLGHIILIGIKKKITLIDSLGFIFIYILNILVAFCQGRKEQNIEKDHIEESMGDKDINKKEIKDINALINDTTSNYKQIELEQKNDSLDYFYKEIVNAPLEKSFNKEDIIGEIKEDIQREQELFINNKKKYKERINENMVLAKIYLKKKYLTYKEEDWGDIAPYWKVFYIVIDLPLTWIRELTIPVSEKKSWNKRKFCFLPLGNFIFISYVFNCK